MIKNQNGRLLPRHLFVKQFIEAIFIGWLIIALALGVGMLGYHHFENMTWVDAFVNASMILSGMGPLTPLVSNGGKIFAGFYALFSGLAFIIVLGIIFAPVLHRFFHKMHLSFLEEGKN